MIIVSIASIQENPFKFIFFKIANKQEIISWLSLKFFSFKWEYNHLAQLEKFSKSFNLNLEKDWVKKIFHFASFYLIMIKLI